jgi:hypothetical protein
MKKEIIIPMPAIFRKRGRQDRMGLNFPALMTFPGIGGDG